MTELGHIHQFVPADGDDDAVLLMLHGTGGDENDLLPHPLVLAGPECRHDDGAATGEAPRRHGRA